MAGIESGNKTDDMLQAVERNPVTLGAAIAALLHRFAVLRENQRTPITPQQAAQHEQTMRDTRVRNADKTRNQ